MKNLRYVLPVILTLAMATSGGATADSKKNVCLVDRSAGSPPLNTFVLEDPDSLNPGRSISIRGYYFTRAGHVAPLYGGAVMVSDGSVRLGLFVNSSADSTNDFTLSGVTDSHFAGTLSFDNDGDFRPNGTLTLEVASCDSITIP